MIEARWTVAFAAESINDLVLINKQLAQAYLRLKLINIRGQLARPAEYRSDHCSG